MNLLDAIDPQYLDINGLVKPKISYVDTGNGILYTSIAYVLHWELGNFFTLDDINYFKNIIRECYIKKGCLKRSPTKTDQETWDDYLGVLAACIAIGDHELVKEILAFGCKHAFFFDTDGKITLDDFLGRYLHLWALYWITIFPLTKIFFQTPLYVVGLFLKPDTGDSGGVELLWLFRFCLRENGITTDYKGILKILPEAFTKYYGGEMPFIEASKILVTRMV